VLLFVAAAFAVGAVRDALERPRADAERDVDRVLVAMRPR
jgi:hypothetical protein